MKATINQSGTSTVNLKSSSLSFASVVRFAKRTILASAAVTSLARLFSSLLDQEVTPVQALRIINLVIALCFTVFPVQMPLVLRIMCVAWLAKAVSDINTTELFSED